MKYSPAKFLTHYWLNGIDSFWFGLSILAILKVGGVFLSPFTWPITWDGFRKIPSHSRTTFGEKSAHFSKMILLSLVESACYAGSSIAIASTILGIFPMLFSAPVTCAIGGTCLLTAGTTIWIENCINQEKRRQCDESLQTTEEDFSILPWLEYYSTFSSTEKESWKHSLCSFFNLHFLCQRPKNEHSSPVPKAQPIGVNFTAQTKNS